jgi:DNA repair protein RecO (recombination protein O)
VDIDKNQTVHAISIGFVKYGDSSLISTCYTLEYGTQSYMLKGILSKGRKKVSKSLFEPLNLLELQASKNPENRLGYVKEVKLHSPYSTIPYDISKKALVFFLSEVLLQIFREEQGPNPKLFLFIKKKLIWLDTQDHLGIFHIKMMLELSKFIGFYPNISNSKAPYFDLGSGCMSYVKPNDHFIEEPIKSYWIIILGTAFDELRDIKPSKKQKAELLDKVVLYFVLHLQQFKPPKSTEILNEIFKTP